PGETPCPNRKLPAFGSLCPARMRSRLVLPAPLRPMIKSRCPRSTSNETSRNTSGPPYPLARPVAVKTTRPLCGGSGNRTFTFRSRFGADTCSAFMRSTRLKIGFRRASPLLGLAPHDLRQHAQPLDLRLLPLRQRRQSLLLEHPRLLVLRIRAAVLAHPPCVQVKHARDRSVQ